MAAPESLSVSEPSRPRSGWRRDLWGVVLVTLGCYVVSSELELHERYFAVLARYERWQADELPLSLLVLACGMAWFAFRRRRDAQDELRRREQAEAHVSALLAHNRELSQGLIALQESERLALARELHDELGQSCTAIRAETAWLRHCDGADRAGMLAAAARADVAAQNLYQLVRDLLRRLRPANLDTLGLVAAVQELCEAWEERSGVACIFHHEGMDALLADTINVTVYRVTQEALTNVMRHARASSVKVLLTRRDPAGVCLTIQDDGRGMDVAAASRGLGLLGATERAAAVGGALEVHSALGTGVRVLLRIPPAAVVSTWREAA